MPKTSASSLPMKAVSLRSSSSCSTCVPEQQQRVAQVVQQGAAAGAYQADGKAGQLKAQTGERSFPFTLPDCLAPMCS